MMLHMPRSISRFKIENTFTYPFFTQHLSTEHPELQCVACRRHFETAEDVQAHFTISPAHPKCNDCGRGFRDDDARNAVSVILCCTLSHSNVFLKKHRDNTDNPVSLQAPTTDDDNDASPLDGRIRVAESPPSIPFSGPVLVREYFIFQHLSY
jgi:hypothetical protein